MEARIVLAQHGTLARYLGSVLVPEDGVVFCLFAASSTAEVRRAGESASVPMHRIHECVLSETFLRAAWETSRGEDKESR
jgi:hypothetical protein